MEWVDSAVAPAPESPDEAHKRCADARKEVAGVPPATSFRAERVILVMGEAA